VDVLLASQEFLWMPEEPDPMSINGMLEARGVPFTTLSGWQRLDVEEIERGRAKHKERIKIVSRDEMLSVSNDA